MADLLDHQWELDGVVFGHASMIGHEAEVAPPSRSWRTQDTPSPIGDGMVPGRDRIDPGLWSFQLYTNCDDPDSALRELSTISQVWRGDSIRNIPGEVLPLRYRLAGRVRRVYGRPRRFDAPLDNRYLSGYIPITCDFQTVSDLFFDDAEITYSLNAGAPTAGGFTFPITFPFTTQNQLATRPNSFVVTGDMPTPPIFEFTGPVTDPFIEVDGTMRVELTGEIAAGVTVIVDARPWVMSAYREDGAGLSGIISPRTRLPRLWLEPGAHDAVYGGYDPTGASSAVVKWRAAYPSV